MTRHNRILLSCVYWAFVAYVFVPLILMVMMGFKDSNFIGFPIRSWTLDWYTGVLADTETLTAFGYSVSIAVLSTVFSVIVGTWIAVLLEGRKFWGRAAIFGMTVLPALIPGIISAIAFRIYARYLGIEPGMGAIVWSHAVHNVPFVVLVVMARLSTLPKSQIEAARDLGAEICHLGQEDYFESSDESQAASYQPALGLSTHAPEQAIRAMETNAAYLAIGPIFPTPTKPGRPGVTLDYVRWAAANVGCPWFAIGGITLENIDSVLEAGARRICVVSAILNAPDVARACQQFNKRLASVPLQKS